MTRRLAIVGSGGWGTALAVVWSRHGLDVALCTRSALRADELRRDRENRRLLPGVEIPDELRISCDMEQILDGAFAVVLAAPSKHMRRTVRDVARYVRRDTILISASKGLESSGAIPLRMSQVISSEFALHEASSSELSNLSPQLQPVAAISGPSHAEEVGRGLPSTLVIAGASAELLRDILSTKTLRLYTSVDLIGVELGGTLKNPIAIAAGIAKGLGIGDNAMGALITRGIAEVTRFGVAAGADAKTFAGLSGIGDMITTCISPHSRNVRVGMELACGEKLEAILERMGMVAEGVETARHVDAWARGIGEETPITSAVARVLFNDSDPKEELEGLMSRSLKNEF